MDLERPGYVYLIETKGNYRLGSTTNVDYHIEELQKGSPFKITLMAQSNEIEDAGLNEFGIHKMLEEMKRDDGSYDIPDRVLKKLCQHIRNMQ